MKRHWTINGRFLTQRLTGVQRHAVEVTRALDALISAGHPLARNVEISIAAPSGSLPLPDLQHIDIRNVGRLGGHAWEQIELFRHAPGGLLSFCNTGPIAHTHHIACIHDANTRIAPDSYSRAFRTLYLALMPALGIRCRFVTTVSHYSAAELVRWNIAAPDKIRVVSNGHEHVRRWTPRHTAQTRAVAGPRTIFVLGSPAPHKNVAVLAGLGERLAAAGLKLAVAGLADGRVFQARASEPSPAHGIHRHGIHWLGPIDDDALSAMIDDCLCLAVPSRVEGFGLPALEAMARGCPVVAAPCGSLPEICGDATLLADPDRPDAWLDAFQRLANDADLRERLRDAGMRRATAFSWRSVALAYIAAMAEADGFPAGIAAEVPIPQA